MERMMLRAKIHRVTVTERDVAYEGSLTLDRALMEAAGMMPFERVEVYDVDNGARFATYLIEGEPGSGACCVNGAAAHLVEEGDKLILCTYVPVAEEAAPEHRPTVVLVDTHNRVREVRRYESASTRALA